MFKETKNLLIASVCCLFGHLSPGPYLSICYLHPGLAQAQLLAQFFPHESICGGEGEVGGEEGGNIYTGINDLNLTSSRDTSVRASNKLGGIWRVMVTHSFYGETKTNRGKVSRPMSSVSFSYINTNKQLATIGRPFKVQHWVLYWPLYQAQLTLLSPI